ncbi:MAG TPA: DUF202 domain-containing protein [Candidatus Saccharimonadales bacterium]|nr:DUF202 domain-containing protein [Candidatus Saccharimonadales bacterium]
MKSNKDKNLGPDIQFLLANERTLLAWIRTALAVLAGGIVLIQFAAEDSNAQDLVGTAVVILGAFMATVGYIRFKAADKAIRRGELPIIGNEPLIQTGAVILVALVLATTHIINLW